MTVLATARARVTGPPATQLAECSALCRGDELAECIGVLSDGFLSILGRNPSQRVGLRVYLDGVRIDQHLLGSGWEVAREITQANATARFDTTATGKPLGNPLALSAPPPGMGSIDLRLVFRLDDGTEREVPLLTNGMTDSAPRESDGRVTRDSIAIRDAGARYRSLRFDYLAPAGSNMLAEAIIRALATRAGSPHNIAGHPWRVLKELRVGQGEDWFAPAQSLAEVEGGFLGWDRLANLTSFFDRPEVDTSAPRWVWTPDDIVLRAGGALYGVRVEAAPDPAHRVVVEGTEQITREGACGLEVVELTSESIDDNYTTVPLGWRQAASTGTVTASGVAPSGPWPGTVVVREVKRLERECGTLIGEEIRRYTFYNPGRARYDTDGDQNITNYHACFIAADEAEENGFSRVIPWFQLTFRELRTRTFIGGYLRRVVTDRYGFRWVQAAIRNRANRGQAWETQSGDVDQMILGDGTRVTEETERIRLTERVIEEIDVEGGRVPHKATTTYGWNRRPGYRNLYADNFESADAEEQFRQVDRFEEFWAKAGEQLHEYSLVRSDGTGNREQREGDIPAAERHQGVEVDPDLFDTPEEAAAAVEASRWEQRPLKVTRTMPQVLEVRPGRDISIRSQRAETLAQLDRIALRTLLSGFSCRVRLYLAPNPYVERGDLAHVVFPAIGLDHDVVVEAPRWSQAGPGEPVLLEISGRTRP